VEAVTALDTISGGVTTVVGTPTAIVLASGDSLSVRAFPNASNAYLENLVLQGAVQANIGSFRVRSPRLHDNVQGIRLSPGELVSAYGLPAQTAQPLYPVDLLIAEITGATAAEAQQVAIFVRYDSLPGSDAPYAMWGDIAGRIIEYKPVQVVLGALVANTWLDTVITTTENLLEADTKYAVLGYSTNAPLTAVGVKGQETGNLRACGPGTSSEFPTTEWFIRMSDKHGTPHIPVVSANNAGSIFVSAITRAAVGAGTICELILAQLSG
jgi:hypothetical protein